MKVGDFVTVGKMVCEVTELCDDPKFTSRWPAKLIARLESLALIDFHFKDGEPYHYSTWRKVQ